MPREAIHRNLHQTLSKAIDSGAVSAIRARPAPTVGEGAIQHYAPEYNPDRWNEYDKIRENNNCYKSKKSPTLLLGLVEPAAILSRGSI